MGLKTWAKFRSCKALQAMLRFLYFVYYFFLILRISVCMFVYSCTSEVQWVTKLNLSFKKLSIQFIQDLDSFIFLSNFSKNIKEFHLQIVTFGIFYSQSACTSCVLPISTWQICLPMLDAHDNLFKSVSLSVCYHHSGHRSLPVFPYFLLSLWFLAHVNWSNF